MHYLQGKGMFKNPYIVFAPFLLIFILNILFEKEIIDPRNKAYGLDYISKSRRPAYNKTSLQSLCTPDKLAADKANMIGILNKWKAKQKEEKPLLFFLINIMCFLSNGVQTIPSDGG